MTELSLAEGKEPSGEQRLLGPLQGTMLLVAMVAIAAANFMAFLDVTIASVALPHIGGTFGVTPSEGVWVMTSYAVAEAISVPLTGWVASRFGSLRVFVVASLAFGAFSLACGLAPSLAALVFARILQGLAGGFLMPLSQVLLQAMVPPKKANMATAVWGMTAIGAPILGPVFGGMLSDNAGWQWCFLVNVPVALFCGVVPWMLLSKFAQSPVRSKVDYVGLGLLIVWVGALQIMLDTGEQNSWFDSTWIVSLAVVAAIGFVSFVIWEITERVPIVELRVFRYRMFSVATLVMAVSFGSLSAFNVIFVLWLQNAMGYTATWAGYAAATFALPSVIVTPIVAFLMGRLDVRVLVSVGLAIMSASFFMRASYASNIAFGSLMGAQILTGIGGTAYYLAITGMSVAGLDHRTAASAAGLFNFARTLSMAFGMALGTALWNSAARANHAELVASLNTSSSAGDLARSFAGSPDMARSLLDLLVQKESVMLATDHIFGLLGLLIGTAAVLIWLSPKPVGTLAASAH